MSTRKFNAKGMRHGFPQKLITEPVQDLPWWTTLSGVNADNYAFFTSPENSILLAEKIAESHQMAADLFYRLKTVYGTANASDNGGSGNSVSLAASYGVGHEVDGVGVIPSEPYERVASGSPNPFAGGTNIETNSLIEAESPYVRVSWGRAGRIGQLVRMELNGDLVGYGFDINASFQNNYTGIGVHASTAASTRCAVLLASGATSYFEDEALSNPNYVSDLAYTTEQGYHFVGIAWALGSDTRSADIAARSASATTISGSRTISVDAEFTDFDFYETFT